MTVALNLEARKSPGAEGWFRRAESWLDDRGKGAWIAVMVLGFVFFWPVGLALLAYMIWSKRMFSKDSSHSRSAHDTEWTNRRHGFRPSGNSAFDAYKADTLKRLMDEQEQFETFLERLRAAKDQQEFDAFMDERAETARKARAQRAEAADEADEDGDAADHDAPAKA
ncbi:DUF2852 domain-containing protein [Sinisalibacter lacisalsi]|uniref:DUF2852 domain-containing protein n=1 Tax=Sinisalibacter lacisalsi TaxID=1526570 RepID=A0ABQ1QL38_9RHOB|nr:DUF2852 domain-containing protein [Sinisalibacter lacisalsi]GGD32498.1 hypothetical protein GCM10011358_15780 [Sinisalibacter lacisalsi]